MTSLLKLNKSLFFCKLENYEMCSVGFCFQVHHHASSVVRFSIIITSCYGSDFHFTSWGLIVSVKWSKVIQFRERTLLIPLVSIPSHALCPVHALRDFFDTCPAPASSPAFVLPTATGLRSISYSSFTKHLKDLLRLAGLNPDNYSGHSFRRGGATYASSLGIPHELIQLQGDWASTAYLEYLARPLRQRLSLAQTVASQLGSSTSPT